MIEFETEICRDFERAASLEWFETNGIGGYASSTIVGAHSRRYHGLLVAATKPPLGRVVMLSKFEETLIINGERFELSANRYPQTVYPAGFNFLTSFKLDPFPIWTYEAGGLVLEKRLFLVHGENTAVVTWSLPATYTRASLELRPLLAFRDHHHLQHVNDAFETGYNIDKNVITFKPYRDLQPLCIASNAGSVEPSGEWYSNFEYEIERERGFDFSEDLYQPCVLTFELDTTAVVIAANEPKETGDAPIYERNEFTRRGELIDVSRARTDFAAQLVMAADQFIVDRGEGKTVIAGYPWFSDWGRDTMIALPGLTLSTNRHNIAKSIITEFSLHISQGMIPNRFPDRGEEPEYNTVDATLWYFEAIRAYVEATSDLEFVKTTLYDKLVDVIDWHIYGTRYQIKVDDDGLLYAGEPGVQLTWMDAKIGDWVVTPRTGKAVEIQALWYNALRIMALFAEQFGDTENYESYVAAAEFAKVSFNEQFWNDDENCLYDVINGTEKDGSVRPNQIFAVSLTHQIVADERATAIVDKVKAELLTPVGLRSLSPNDPRYVPMYIGSPHDRDAGYHQGAVWGWLIGGFVDAYRKVHADKKGLHTSVARMLKGFRSHLREGAVGQVSEIFDGDPPYLPRGCGAQAWSVAELLRVLR
jgi:predicted glycogen debranching enzyme